MPDSIPVIATSFATKQTSWIATPGLAGLAMTLTRLPARSLSGLIWIYQRTLSPALAVASPHAGCRFAPTCSCYARLALAEHGLFAGVALTAARLAKCGPWHPGGEDPVPPRKISCIKVTKSNFAES
jgi:putative membrane protein insertion efficiency factor